MNTFEQGIARYLSSEDQKRIRGVRIGIAGAGGLGSNCAWMLVRSGFTDFVIADYDRVEASNLNRQFYFAGQIGQLKVEALRQNLLAINPAVSVRAVETKVSPANAASLFAECHAVIEAFDEACDKKMLVEALLPAGKFLVTASGIAGYGDSDRIQTHRIKHNFFMVGDMVSEASIACPPLAPCVTLAAAKEADLVLDWGLRGMP